ncbi:MAG: ComF family protein [candidate division WOR-3 bacterium]
MKFVKDALAGLIDFFLPPVCSACGAGGKGPICNACRSALVSLSEKHLKSTETIEVLAPFRYAGPAKNIVVDFKYHGIRGLAGEMARFMAERIRDLDIRSLVPVPLHRARIRERGYSQTRLLAVCISGITGIPVVNCLRRRRYTTPQVELSGRERLSNLQNAFVFKGPMPLEPVAIIDDITTTGTTLEEAGRVLPAKRKIGLVFAIAGEGEDSV